MSNYTSSSDELESGENLQAEQLLSAIDQRLLDIFTDTILVAHKRKGNSWSLYSDGKPGHLTLSVNQTVVIKLSGRGSVMWAPGSYRDPIYSGRLPIGSNYKDNRGKRAFQIPRAAPEQILDVLESAKHANRWAPWITLTAGDTQEHCRGYKDFAPELLKALSYSTGVDLPYPTYAIGSVTRRRESRNTSNTQTYPNVNHGAVGEISSLADATPVPPINLRPIPLAPITPEESQEISSKVPDVNMYEISQELESMGAYLDHTPILTEGLELQLVQRYARPRHEAFRLAIRRAYANRCAVCKSTLRTPSGIPEVEAAHIYPKRLDGRDDPRNGVSLCRRHHWAFDAGWISFDDEMKVLVRVDLPDASDYEFIRGYEGKLIEPPSDARLTPHPFFLRQHRILHGFESDA